MFSKLVYLFFLGQIFGCLFLSQICHEIWVSVGSLWRGKCAFLSLSLLLHPLQNPALSPLRPLDVVLSARARVSPPSPACRACSFKNSKNSFSTSSGGLAHPVAPSRPVFCMLKHIAQGGKQIKGTLASVPLRAGTVSSVH